MTSNRIVLYCIFSTFAVVATIASACRAHSNFYSVSIYLSRSSRSVLVLANFGFLCSLLLGRILQKLFFGTLQPREVERLYDQTWMFVTESLLAFTIFRDEFDVPFLLMFGFLLFVKCFHWLMADRVESMDQTTYPGPPTRFHVRINSLFFVLWVVDSVMFAFAVESTLTHGVGGMVLFASEYAILLASALNAILRYTLSLLDLRRARTRGGENAPPWENKSMYIFYVELLTDFLKLATYMTFFMIILTFYGLPLNIIRDVFVTARSFITRLRALVRYHNATRDMDRRYPDATEAELAEMSDRTCIICREEMHTRNAGVAQAAEVGPPANQPTNGEQQPQQPATSDGPNMTPKKLPCGHIFHFQCLRSWLERQQSCPTCRRTVLETNAAQTQNQAPGQGQARVAAPRPGAAPVPAARPGQPGAGGAANPFGWIGRFFGIPPQPPALDGQLPGAQGQFAQGAAPAFQQQHPQFNAGWRAAIPGQVPPQPPYYDPMPGWQHHIPGQVPQPQMQPQPVFRGFYGPGQAWQPWGDPQWYEQPPQPPLQPGQQPMQPPAQHVPAEAVRVPPTPPIVVVDEQRDTFSQQDTLQPSTPTLTSNGVASESSTQPSTSPASTSERSLDDPRAAAALAALRRRQSASATPVASSPVDSGRSTSIVPASAVQSSSTVSSLRSPPVPASASLAAGSTTTLSPAPVPATSSTTAAVPPPTAAQDMPVPIQLPSLIPLYDPGIVQPTRAPSATPFFAPYNHFYHSPPVPAPGYRGSAPARGVQPPRMTVRPTFAAPSGLSGPRSGTEQTSLSQLPATLTEEQLARLDRLTREAIDERLRVLEGVSGAIYRCMEELTRVRSVLPARARSAQGPAALGSGQGSGLTSASTGTSTNGRSAGIDAKGKSPVKADGSASSSEEEQSSSASSASVKSGSEVADVVPRMDREASSSGPVGTS